MRACTDFSLECCYFHYGNATVHFTYLLVKALSSHRAEPCKIKSTRSKTSWAKLISGATPLMNLA